MKDEGLKWEKRLQIGDAFKVIAKKIYKWYFFNPSLVSQFIFYTKIYFFNFLVSRLRDEREDVGF